MRPTRALLRDDLNHAVRGFGSIDRRGGRTLDDLDALDVIRADVVQTSGDRRALTAKPAGAPAGPVLGRVVDADAIDVDERTVLETDAAPPADLNRRTRAETSTALEDRDAGRAALEKTRNIGRLRLAP